MMKPYQRNIEGSRISYEVLSSKKTFYYTVHMLDDLAIDCECDRFTKGHKHCGHMTTAEQAEREFRQSEISRSSSSTQQNETEKEKRATAPLNGSRAFSMLR